MALERIIKILRMKTDQDHKLSQLYSILRGSRNDSFSMHESAKKAPYHRENFSAFLEGRYSEVRPVSVEIVPSLECNFKCENCTYWQNRSKTKAHGEKRIMEEGIFDKILYGLKEIYTRSIIFIGGGEPAINPLYLKFMGQASKEGFEIGLYSNGAMIKEEEIEQLLKINPSFIRVSLNRVKPKTHAEWFGYAEKDNEIFNKITNNIVKLGRARKELGASTTIGIGFIISEKNCSDSELENISNFLLELSNRSDGGINYAAFRPEVYYFDEGLNVVTEQPNAKIFAKISDQLEEKVRKVVEQKSNMDILINREAFGQLSRHYQDKPNIANPWSASFDYDGRCYITSEHNGMEGFCIGDVRKSSVEEIWGGKSRRELMRQMESGEIKPLQNYKLKTLNDLLLEIRSLGRFSQQETEEFYRNFDLNKKPPHVNFI